MLPKGNMAYMGRPHHNKVKNVTLCHLILMQGRHSERGKYGTESKKHKNINTISVGCQCVGNITRTKRNG